VAQTDYWYKNAIIYCLDVSTYLDSDGDGIGDFQGLISRLSYIERLGATAIWLLPFYPTPDRDNGYDVSDYYGIDPRLGNFGDFVEFMREANGRGIEVIVDLVANHTSDQHPWFQEARRDRNSRFRNYYIWSDEPIGNKKSIFPGVEDSVWTWDEEAGQYYYHRFYHHEPELNIANPDVREEIRKIMGFWLQLGVTGFRIDAASHMIEQKGHQQPEDPHGVLEDMHRFSRIRRSGAVLIGEADVDAQHLGDYFGDGDELQLLFNFLLNNYIYLALAREDAEPLRRALQLLPKRPKEGQWANFLRNHDELDLERLTRAERAEVMKRFGPKEEMQIYHRGIRRRLAPMLRGDRQWMELAFSLLFTLPGAVVLNYGQEIGMGDDLKQKERNSVRTPMQWSTEKNAGFSTADAKDLTLPVISRGPFSYKKVNVASQQREEDSFLSFVMKLIHTRRECPELGWAEPEILELEDPAIFAHRCSWEGGTVIAAHNLANRDATCRIELDEKVERIENLLSSDEGQQMDRKTGVIQLGPHGYRWFRINAAPRSGKRV
jgi:maltose alpha-D-glucosyltransferase / alpha-amylase